VRCCRPAEDRALGHVREEAQNTLSFASHPLYALVHEPCYAQAGSPRRGRRAGARRVPEFSPERATSGDAPLLFTGRPIIRGIPHGSRLRPLREAADLLAERTDWAPLYDADVLAENRVPVAAIVTRRTCTWTPASSQTLSGSRPASLDHERVRARRYSSSGDAVFERLLRMADGEI